MKESIARFRNVLVARMDLLEEEARLAEAEVKEKKGDYRHLAFENVAILERTIAHIEKIKRQVQAVDLEQFQSIPEFRDYVLARLQELYDQRPFIRPAVRMVMACVRDLSKVVDGSFPA